MHPARQPLTGHPSNSQVKHAVNLLVAARCPNQGLELASSEKFKEKKLEMGGN
ncbi:MAG: hypothetical protein AB2693_21045 [Candidatus Thiodiazotropha sp.]